LIVISGQILPLLTSSKSSPRASCHVTDSYCPFNSSHPAHNSTFIVPFLIPAGSGTSFVGLRGASESDLVLSNEVVLSQDFQVPFGPGTQVC
jgi:hypothetical protein